MSELDQKKLRAVICAVMRELDQKKFAPRLLAGAEAGRVSRACLRDHALS
jgi:hypothetical protein